MKFLKYIVLSRLSQLCALAPVCRTCNVSCCHACLSRETRSAFSFSLGSTIDDFEENYMFSLQPLRANDLQARTMHTCQQKTLARSAGTRNPKQRSDKWRNGPVTFSSTKRNARTYPAGKASTVRLVHAAHTLPAPENRRKPTESPQISQGSDNRRTATKRSKTAEINWNKLNTIIHRLALPGVAVAS